MQMIWNGLVTGMTAALPAIALTLTYSILKFPNFAVGAMLTTSAYIAYVLNSLGLPMWLAAGATAIVFAAVAALIDGVVFRPLRSQDAVTLLVASMGLSFVLENIVRFVFGPDARSFNIEVARPMRVFDIRINVEQLQTAVVALLAMGAIFFILRFTPLGRAMRAAADNPALAAVRGINLNKVIIATWAVAGALIAVGGVLIGMDRAIDPLLGWNYVVTVFAAAILGGLGNVLGAVLGALIIGVAEELSTLLVQPSYRSGVGFVVIACILMARPNGLLGKGLIKK